MKKLTKTAFSIVLVLGVIVCGTSMASASARIARVDEKFSVLDESGISIELSSSDIYIGLSPDDTVRITYHNTKHFEYKIRQNDDELVLKQITLVWSNSTYSKEITSVMLLIPKQFSGDFTVETSSGLISTATIKVKSIDMSSSSGEIEVKNVSSKGDILITSTSGDKSA